MDIAGERRSELRFKTNIPIIFRSFHALDYYRANELNHSKDGIALEVGFEINPGLIVQIRHEKCPENCPDDKACESCHGTILATVNWYRERNVGGVSSYLVGAKYFPYSLGY